MADTNLAAAQELQQALQGPALAPPLGITPDFDNLSNLKTLSYVMMGVHIAVPTIVVVLRLYTKLYIVRAAGWEDWVTVMAWSLYIPYCAYSAVMVRNGAGQHQWNVRLGDMQAILYNMNVLFIIYGVTTFLVKFSILLQYLRIFSPHGCRNLMWWGCWSLSAILFVFYTTVTLVVIFICSPREKFWTPWLTSGHCMDAFAVNIASGITNSLADLVIILLPQRSIWLLHLSWGRRMRLSIIFLLALFALAASIVRLYYAFRLASSGDVTYNVDLMGIWTYAEFTATFVCSCLPSLAALGRRLWPILVAITKNVNSNSSSKNGILLTARSNVNKNSLHPRNIRGRGKIYTTMHTSVSELDLVVARSHESTMQDSVQLQ